MAEYKIPDEYFFRIHHVRPRFKGDIENVLIYMAEEISRIGECETSKFVQRINAAIYNYPGNVHRELKTINNWRTEISALFGFIEREYENSFLIQVNDPSKEIMDKFSGRMVISKKVCEKISD